MKANRSKVQRGIASKFTPLYPDLLKTDTRKPLGALLKTGEFGGGGGPVPRSRYYDPAFAALEMEHVWKKTWQIAAREEDIPEVGDRVTYDVGPISYIIIRSEPKRFKAFYNSCLHRGTKLCARQGHGEQIRCPFHGWTWNIDGSVKEITSAWDFPEVSPQKYRLPEVKLECWGGNIFINPDPNAKPLKKALGVLADHFKDYDFENRWSAANVRKKMRANWKTAMEAFLEGWHLSETHPQAQCWNGDTASQYDIWEDDDSQISRSITPSAVPSPELGDTASSRQAAIETVKAVTPPGMDLPDFDSIEDLDRHFAAEWRRKVLQNMTGRDCSKLSDAEMLDAVQYYMFPNFFPWLGEGAPLWYQFTPYGNDPNQCVMHIRYLLPLPADGKRPPAAEVLELDFDETFQQKQAGFGLFDEVFDQDMSNVPLVQEGCKTGSPDTTHITLGTYQECRIQAFHARLAKMVGV